MVILSKLKKSCYSPALAWPWRVERTSCGSGMSIGIGVALEPL
jgi:hypothetical protein